MNNFLSPRAVMGAAIVGLVGAAGMFIYEQIYAEKRRAMLVKDMARLDNQVATLRDELETLRELQKQTQAKKLKQRKVMRERMSRKPAANRDVTDGKEVSYGSDSEYYTDYQSMAGTDLDMEEGEEFYDVVSDSDTDATLRESPTCPKLLRNGAARGPQGDTADDTKFIEKEKSLNDGGT